jgi:hypothetical protein
MARGPPSTGRIRDSRQQRQLLGLINDADRIKRELAPFQEQSSASPFLLPQAARSAKLMFFRR